MTRILVLAVLALPSLARAEDDDAWFTAHVKPVLEERCIGCHGPEKQKAHLRLDSRAAVLAGGEGGAAAVPGKPEESLLVKAIGYKDEDLQMPPKGKRLPDDQIATLTEWIKRGMPYPEENAKRAPEEAGKKTERAKP